MEGFAGFRPRTLEFLDEVRARNSKPWFEEHRGEYEDVLLTPLRLLTAALSGTVIGIDGRIDTAPVVNRTISKIFRDTRFSKDKSLFRNVAWLSFKRRDRRDVTVPEFYFVMTPDTYQYGMGYYAADRKSMDRFRAAIERDPAAFRKTLAFERRSLTGGKGAGPGKGARKKTVRFERFEDLYKRTIANSAPGDLQEWFRIRSFAYRVMKKSGRRLYSPALAEDIAAAWSQLGPLYSFLIEKTL